MILSIRENGAAEYLARTCVDWSEEAIVERDPSYRLPGCELQSWDSAENVIDTLA